MSHYLPDSYEDLFRRAQAHVRAGESQAAIDLYRRLAERLGRVSERLVTRRPELRSMHLQASLQMAEVLQSEGRYPEAIEVEEGLVNSYPEQSTARRRDVALLRVASGEVSRGLAELRALGEEEPGHVWNWILLGNEARLEGLFPESQAALDRALEEASRKEDPKLQAEVLYSRFRLFQEMGQLDNALAAWEDAASREPDVVRSVPDVYTMLTKAGRYLQAQDYVARDTNPLQAGLQRGLLAELTGNPAAAAQAWREVAALDPEGADAGQECWMEAVLRLGDPAPVLEKAPSLLRRHGTLRLLILWGIAFAMLGEGEPAHKLFEQSIGLLRRSRPPKQKLDGDDWHLLNSLVEDEKLKAKLKPHFAVVETIWGQVR